LSSIGGAERLEHAFVYRADVTSLPLQFEFSFEDENHRVRFVDPSKRFIINDVGISS
jgi:hypothetical protein